MIPATKLGLDLQIPLAHSQGLCIIRASEFSWQFARSGGPGGQNVNKLATKAVLRWWPRQSALPPPVLHRLLKLAHSYLTTDGELIISSQRHRTQLRNMDDCLQKLRQLIVAAVPPPTIRRATKPTRGSKERRLHAKKQQSARKADRRVSGHDA